MQNSLFNYKILEQKLAESETLQRQVWAKQIIENQVDLKTLSPLLYSDRKTAMRFAWLLTDIALIQHEYLFNFLPYFFQLRKEVTQFPFEESFANYWRFCGIPEENESEAIDLLFSWLRSSTTNKTIKSRAQKVLLKLCEKYPELRNEMEISK